jgi:hypothetical protein
VHVANPEKLPVLFGFGTNERRALRSLFFFFCLEFGKAGALLAVTRLGNHMNDSDAPFAYFTILITGSGLGILLSTYIGIWLG